MEYIVVSSIMNILFFELIRVSLGIQKELSKAPSVEEWNTLFEISQKQALAGVCGNGVQLLYKNPHYAASIPKSLFLQWLGFMNAIQEDNQKVNRRCVKLINYFTEQGVDCSILKGQGLAAIYRNEAVDLRLLRQSGDIDLWLGEGRKKVWSCLSTMCKDCEYDYKTIHPPFFSDTEVEVHWIPEILMNLISNRKLQQFWKVREKELYSNSVELPNEAGRISVPSIALNRFYILLHCYRHAFDEGVGLRQVMDYYFVLRQDNDRDGRAETMKLVREYGMSKFAAALMWIMQEVFHLEEDYLLCAPNEQEGCFLLNDIMQSGNFGHFDQRVKAIGEGKHLRALTTNLQRARYLITHYPMEVLWAPVWMAYHFVWKRSVGRMG